MFISHGCSAHIRCLSEPDLPLLFIFCCMFIGFTWYSYSRKHVNYARINQQDMTNAWHFIWHSRSHARCTLCYMYICILQQKRTTWKLCGKFYINCNSVIMLFLLLIKYYTFLGQLYYIFVKTYVNKYIINIIKYI